MVYFQLPQIINLACKFCIAFQPLNISNFQVPKLTGDNYKLWKEKILLQLEWMDIDDAIRKNEPPKPTDTSSASAIALYDRWE